MDIKKWFKNQNIEPVQDRKDMMDYWTNYELFTYNDLMECLEALFELRNSSLTLPCELKRDLESKRLAFKFYEETAKDEKESFIIGFRFCYRWLKRQTNK